MQSNRAAAIAFVRADEGGYNASDPSNHGITLDAYRVFLKRHGRPQPTLDDLRAIPDADVSGFYSDLADRIGFDALPAGVDYAAMDAATNEGEPGVAAILLLTKVLTDPRARIQAMSDIRLAVKRLRPQWAKNGPGWSARIGTRVPQRALSMMEMPA